MPGCRTNVEVSAHLPCSEEFCHRIPRNPTNSGHLSHLVQFLGPNLRHIQSTFPCEDLIGRLEAHLDDLSWPWDALGLCVSHGKSLNFFFPHWDQYSCDNSIIGPLQATNLLPETTSLLQTTDSVAKCPQDMALPGQFFDLLQSRNLPGGRMSKRGQRSILRKYWKAWRAGRFVSRKNIKDDLVKTSKM